MVKGQQLSNNISIWWDGWTVKLLPSIGMSGHIDKWKLTFIDLWKTNDVTHVHKSVLLVSDFIWKIYLQKLTSWIIKSMVPGQQMIFQISLVKPYEKLFKWLIWSCSIFLLKSGLLQSDKLQNLWHSLFVCVSLYAN